jgi:beta-lactamase superfamily II metal-dependent hydrolase
LRFEELEQLSDDQLHVLIFGPGFGESILVRVPHDSWLVVDCLRRFTPEELVPAARVLDHLGVRAAAVALTHPHLDHTNGFPALVERRLPGAPVGCLPTPLMDQWRGAPDAERELRGSATEAALAAVTDAWEREPESRWELVEGESRPLGSGQIDVLHPRDIAVGQRLVARDLNSASSPMVVRWEGASVVLAADLIWRQWNSLPERIDDLTGADALKAPHHGSRNAQHPRVIGTPPPGNRPCLVTPWNKGRRLPRFEDGEGIDLLLAAHQTVELTALPVPAVVPPDGHLKRSEVLNGQERQRFGPDILLDFDAVPTGPLEAWTRVSLDTTGAIRSLSRGSAGVSITSNS